METSVVNGVSPDPGHAIHFRLLGGLEVRCDRIALPLPASKRTRALLGYLIATAVAQSRSALCDLLWEGPDDPRAALRWSLTKLRGVVDTAQAVRLQADREHVAFDPCGAAIDLVEVRSLLGQDVATAPLENMEAAVTLLRGEFLDGLDLPGCYRFHHWCMAERERYGILRRDALKALIARLENTPERALPHGRAMVAADPLAEEAHAALIRLLAASGRYPDAEAHYAYARDLLRREVALAAGGPLDDAIVRARRALRTAQAVDPPVISLSGVPAALAEKPAASPTPLIGREAERRAIELAIAQAGQERARLLLLLGEPGIGKSRLLDHLAGSAAGAGFVVLRGRCFEAEMGRPYGLWLDALRAMASADAAGAPWPDVAPLLAASRDTTTGGDRGHLFEAAATLVQSLAEAQPLALVLDDLQWLDEGSAALLHFVVRSLPPGAPVLVGAAARAGEVEENEWARSLLQSLGRDGRLTRLPLRPLAMAEVRTLLGGEAEAFDTTETLCQTGGNPLYVLELAEARRRGSPEAEGSLDALIVDRLQGLEPADRELLAWAAATGRELRPDLLSAATGVPAAEVIARFEHFQRHGLVKPAAEGYFDFAHDLVRDAIYRTLSQPRRRAIHHQIASALTPLAGDNPELCGEVVRQSSLAGDALATARACVLASEYCLRVFANAEAAAIAERGLASVGELGQGAENVRLAIALLKLRVIAAANPGARRLPALVGEIERAIARAEALGLPADAASGLHILSWLRYQANDPEGASAATLAAERMTRKADAATRCQQLANSARCLLEVERDPAHARALLAEAEAMAETLDLKVIELDWGLGLVARADGDLHGAVKAVARALELARWREDHWREYECAVWLATLELEAGHFENVLAQVEDILGVARRMGESQAPFAEALGALAQQDAGSPELAARLEALRAADDKAHLAYALNTAAALGFEAGQAAFAEACAREALAAAQTVGRVTEETVATAWLALAAATAGNKQGAAEWFGRLPADDIANPPSARAFAAIEWARRSVAAITTPASTPPS